MANTKIVLDRQAAAQTFEFGTTSAAGQGLVTINKGTAAASTVGLDVKGSVSVGGDINVTGNINVSGALNQVTVNTLAVTDRLIRTNKGGTTPTDDTAANAAGFEVEGTSGALVGAIYFDPSSATKFSIGDGTTQVDIVDAATAQTLTNKTLGAGSVVPGTYVTGNISGNAANVTGIVAVVNGGTGIATATANGTIIAGTSGTGNFQVAAPGTAGQVLTSTGPTTPPTYQTSTPTQYQRSTAVTGTQNSSNKAFTIANTLLTGSEQVFLNGQLLNPGAGNDYAISGTTITFDAGFTAPAAADIIRVYGTY